MDNIFQAPIPTIFIVAGLVFIGVAVVGKVVGKIEPSNVGRILSGLLGAVLIAAGLGLQFYMPTQAPTSNASRPPPRDTNSSTSVSLTTEFDTDRFGHDYDHIPQMSHELCRSKCLNDDRCRAYTYDTDPTRESYQICFLKDIVPPQSQKVGDISGVKVP